MYGSLTEYAVLWKSSLGFIWDVLNFLNFGGGYVFRISFFIIKQKNKVKIIQ